MIIENCNVNKLHDEFIQANIKPYPVFDNGNGEGEFNFSNGVDMIAVQAVIDAHNPTPLPPQPTETELMRDYVLDVDYRLIMMELGL